MRRTTEATVWCSNVIWASLLEESVNVCEWMKVPHVGLEIPRSQNFAAAPALFHESAACFGVQKERLSTAEFLFMDCTHVCPPVLQTCLLNPKLAKLSTRSSVAEAAVRARPQDVRYLGRLSFP